MTTATFRLDHMLRAMKRLSVVLFALSAVMLALAAYLFLFTFGHWLSLNVAGSIWDVFAAVGTVGATVVALWLAFRALGRERGAVARLVSAWVEERYEPREDTPAYRRKAAVHIGNESDEPVFNARASVLAGEQGTRLGPLSLPDVIPVVPQRRSLSFDISVPLRAWRGSWNPRVELYFSDASGRRWHRDPDGNLRDVTKSAPAAFETSNFSDEELGEQSLENPMTVALAFLAGLGLDEFDVANISPLLALEANWEETNWREVRADLAEFTVTSFVQYPAPRIALLKLVRAEGLAGKRVNGEAIQVEGLKWLTLTSSPSRGWRVWGLGVKVRPDDILLPEDAFE